MTKVDAFTSSQGAAGVEFPNLRIRFSAVDAAPWQDWFNEFVVGGQKRPGQGTPGDAVALYVAERYVEKMTISLKTV